MVKQKCDKDLLVYYYRSMYTYQEANSRIILIRGILGAELARPIICNKI